MKQYFSLLAALFSAALCSGAEPKPIWQGDFEGFKKFKAPSNRIDSFTISKGRKGLFVGRIVPGAGVGNSVGVSSIKEGTWINNLPLEGKEFALEMKFKLVKELHKKRYSTLFAYSADENFRRRMIVWIHPRGNIQVLFEILNDKKKAVKSFAMSTSALKWQTNKYYSLRFSCISGGAAELELDGKTVASCEENAMSLGDLHQKGGKYFSRIYFGYYPFYGPRTAPSSLLQGYVDEIKIYDKVVRRSAAEKAAAAVESKAALPHLCLDNTWSSSFLVADQPGKFMGTFQRAEEKFWQTAARVRARIEKDALIAEFDCPIPAGMRVTCDPKFFWSSDRVEVFIQPDPVVSKYYQYAVNAAGEGYAGSGLTQNRSTRALFSAKTTDKGFTARIVIPLKEIGLEKIKPGQMFKGNFMRGGKTCGSGSFWAPTGDNWHAVENFAPIICGSRKAYFEGKMAELLKETARLKLTPAVRQGMEDLKKRIASSAVNAAAFVQLEKQFAAMEFSVAQIRFDGMKQLIWQPAPWENNMNISRLAKPVKTIRVYMPRNARRMVPFAVSNLEQSPFLGQMKVFRKWPYERITYQHFGDQPWNAFLNGIRFYEGLATTDVNGKMVYDPIAPFHMNTVLRIPPRTTAPVWMEISSKDLAPGKYTGKLVLKNCGGSGGVETVDLEVTVSTTDIAAFHLDNLQGNTLMRKAWHHENFRKFFVKYNYNYIYSRLGGDVKVYLSYNPYTGKWNVPDTITRLDDMVEKAVASGFDVKKLKFCFYLSWEHRFGGLPDTPAWEKGIRASIPYWLDRLEKKYGIPHEHVVFYPIDEPNGDINNPNTSMAKAFRWLKLLRQVTPRAKIMINPLYAGKSPVFEMMAPYCDIFECYRPELDNTPGFTQRIQKLGKEVWTYNILRKQQSPELYRADYWKNCRDGFILTHFWDLDDSAGGDTFDSSDVTNPKGRIRRDDYAMAYVDFNYGTIMASRRLEAAARGFDETRVAWYCRDLLKKLKKQGVNVSAFEKELADAVAKGAAGSMTDMDEQADVILRLSEKIIQLYESKNGRIVVPKAAVSGAPRRFADVKVPVPAVAAPPAAKAAPKAAVYGGINKLDLDFEKYAGRNIKGGYFDHLAVDSGSRIAFYGMPVRKQGVGNSVAIKCMNTRNQLANLDLNGKKMSLELKFKLAKPVGKNGSVLCGYVACKDASRRMLLRITPKGQLEAVFRVIDPKTKKIIKNTTLTSAPCALKTGVYYTVRLECVSAGRSELFLDGKSIGAQKNAMSFYDLDVKSAKPYKVLFLGFYPFFMDGNVSRQTLNGYIDNIKISELK